MRIRKEDMMMEKRRIILFGLGKVFKLFMDVVDTTKIDIVALCDNNIDLHGKTMLGIQIIEVEKIIDYDFDYVVITSKYYIDMNEQLIRAGIGDECILNFYDFYRELTAQENYLLMDLLKPGFLLSGGGKLGVEKICNLDEKNLFLSAKSFINIMCDKKISQLEEVEFQVFSQFGEDGIIQWLIHNVEIENKIFVEFGVEDYVEANTRFLLMNNNWSGLVIDGSNENIRSIKEWKYLWKYDLQAIAEFITKDNINQIISSAGINGDIGILSIDLDGNDYWILDAIDCVSPRILVCEYNNIYGDKEMVTVPYDRNFVRTEKHFSNLYWGASIMAFCDWAQRNGYYYMGSNSAGNNAFFVRKDCIETDRIPAKAQVFIQSKYRESRGRNGELTYLKGREGLECIKEMELVNLKTHCRVSIADLYDI